MAHGTFYYGYSVRYLPFTAVCCGAASSELQGLITRMKCCLLPPAAASFPFPFPRS
jgi:hypothetical protein